MFCLNCHYDLRELPEHRCPECGQHFDPSDESTYSHARWQLHWRGLAAWACILGLFVFGFPAIPRRYRYGAVIDFLPLILFLAFGFVCAVSATRKEPLPNQILGVIAFIVLLLLCPFAVGALLGMYNQP